MKRSLCQAYVSFNFYFLNSEPTHFLTFMNNGKAFFSLDDTTFNYHCSDQFQLLPGHWQAKRHWIIWDLQKPNLLKNTPDNTKRQKEQCKY